MSEYMNVNNTNLLLKQRLILFLYDFCAFPRFSCSKSILLNKIVFSEDKATAAVIPR